MLKNGFYNLLGTSIRTSISFIAIPLLINLIGIKEYGLWTLVSTILGILTLAQGGLSTSTTVFASRDISENDIKGISETLTTISTTIIFLATLAAVILFSNSSRFVNIFPSLEASQKEVAILSLQVGSLALWSKLIQMPLIGLEQAYQRYGLLNILSTCQALLVNIGMLTLAWLGGKTLSLMIWQSTVSLIMLVVRSLVLWRLLHPYKLRLRWNTLKSKQIFKHSSSIWLTSLGISIFQQGDRLIVGNLLGTTSLGIYAAITSVASKINSLSAVAIQPMLPKISSSREVNDLNIKGDLEKALKANTFLILMISNFLLLLSPKILNILNIPNASSFIIPFSIIIFIYSMYSVNALGTYILLAFDAPMCMVITLTSGIIAIFLIYVFGHNYGLLGAIIGNIGYFGVFLLTLTGMIKSGISTSRTVLLVVKSISLITAFSVINLVASLKGIFSFSIVILCLETLILLIYLMQTEKGFKDSATKLLRSRQ